MGGGRGLGCKVGRGLLQRAPNPGDQGWTLARAGSNRGAESQAGPQDSWSGLRRVIGLAQVQGSGFKIPEAGVGTSLRDGVPS